MNIMNLVESFSPENLSLKDNPITGKWSLTFILKDKVKISIIAGDYLYSFPRHYLNNFNDYDRYEIAFMNPKKEGWFDCMGYVHADLLNLFEDSQNPYLAPYLTISQIQSILNCLNESL